MLLIFAGAQSPRSEDGALHTFYVFVIVLCAFFPPPCYPMLRSSSCACVRTYARVHEPRSVKMRPCTHAPMHRAPACLNRMQSRAISRSRMQFQTIARTCTHLHAIAHAWPGRHRTHPRAHAIGRNRTQSNVLARNGTPWHTGTARRPTRARTHGIACTHSLSFSLFVFCLSFSLSLDLARFCWAV